MEPEAIIRPKPVVSIYEDPSKIFDLMDIHGFILKSKKEYEYFYIAIFPYIHVHFTLKKRKTGAKPREIHFFAKKNKRSNREMEDFNSNIRFQNK